MIFRIVDDVTGDIILSVTAPRVEMAARYLKPGQSLITDTGPAMINTAALKVEGGVIVRRGAPDADPMAGEGLAVTFISADH
ncbi:hypothetical protein [Brevundimonas balnearis]|uniref:Uncharacterized protein n=1 Tax=Brevundimonas balnearis TaxID=1572858 RepID=A0ABV6R105_9CAUL